MRNSVLETDRRTDRQNTSARVELRFAAKNNLRWTVRGRALGSPTCSRRTSSIFLFCFFKMTIYKEYLNHTSGLTLGTPGLVSFFLKASLYSSTAVLQFCSLNSKRRVNEYFLTMIIGFFPFSQSVSDCEAKIITGPVFPSLLRICRDYICYSTELNHVRMADGGGLV